MICGYSTSFDVNVLTRMSVNQNTSLPVIMYIKDRSSGVQIPKCGFPNTVFNTIFRQIGFGCGLYLRLKKNVFYVKKISVDLDLDCIYG